LWIQRQKEVEVVMTFFRGLLVLVLIGGMSGCAGMSATQQRILSGGAIGTAAGVGVAAVAGAPLIVGAAAGAAAGSVGGLVVDQMHKSGR
jgi:osmotically inducible lipoprotein OsmB